MNEQPLTLWTISETAPEFIENICHCVVIGGHWKVSFVDEVKTHHNIQRFIFIVSRGMSSPGEKRAFAPDKIWNSMILPLKKSLMGGRRQNKSLYRYNEIFYFRFVCMLCPGANFFLDGQQICLRPSAGILPLMKIFLPPPLKMKYTPDEKNPGHASDCWETTNFLKYINGSQPYLVFSPLKLNNFWLIQNLQ